MDVSDPIMVPFIARIYIFKLTRLKSEWKKPAKLLVKTSARLRCIGNVTDDEAMRGQAALTYSALKSVLCNNVLEGRYGVNARSRFMGTSR